ncbi:MAG: homoserine O-acetyltransferase [Pseudomonadota bacterium]|nr:homoserine O-acetyltransferase [Pseudomonadota bacterium]
MFIEEKKIHISKPLELNSGKILSAYDLMYETYGQLNDDKSNAVLICHALSGNHHVSGLHKGDEKPGWWDNMIGSGKPINTDKLFVVCMNNLGGCHGSTGPTSINEETNDPYGFEFPIVTVQDWVNSQKVLMDEFAIDKWQFIIGGSLGGMQALQWSLDYPDNVNNAIIIAASPKLTAQNIAFNEVARQAITSDPDWCDGKYLKQGKIPKRGLALARMLGHITYLSDESMAKKFGRDLKQDKINFNFDVEFQIESYLRYQGEKFVTSFDANTYLLMTKALDYFDPFNDGDFVERMNKSKSRFLVISFTSDWRFPPRRSEEIVKTLIEFNKDVSYACIKSDGGHDAFLMKNDNYFEIMRTYIEANTNG